MRYTALALLLCACSSLSTTEREQLALYQRNAKLYWEGNRLDQALGQIERGLELEPDDYMLGTLYGAILLKQSPSSQGTDHRLLDRAIEVLAGVFDIRSERRHEPALLFNYALTLQKQARRHAGEATRLEAMAARSTEPIDTAPVAQYRESADAELKEANHLFEVLLERGELLRLCHYHMLLGARDFGHHEAVVEHSREYLARTALEQTATEAEVRRTNEPLYETDQKVLLTRLRNEELEVRSLLSEYHYDRQEYAIALTMLDRVLELDPKRSSDYYNRGRVLLHLDRDADAKGDFRKFLATTELPASSDKAVFAARDTVEVTEVRDSLTLPVSRRLTTQRHFRRVYRRGRRAGGDWLTVVGYLDRSQQETRVGLSVSKQHGGAVRRNKIKRLLREAFRHERHHLPAGLDLVLIPKKRTERYPLATLRTELCELVERLLRAPRPKRARNKERR